MFNVIYLIKIILELNWILLISYSLLFRRWLYLHLIRGVNLIVDNYSHIYKTVF